jgi:hypothetical protein
MKDIYAGLIALTLVAAPGVSVADTFFSDTFSNGSTLNGSSVPGGTATASSTSYDIASTKDALSQSSIGSGLLRLKLAAGTSSGFWEAQALFTEHSRPFLRRRLSPDRDRLHQRRGNQRQRGG